MSENRRPAAGSRIERVTPEPTMKSGEATRAAPPSPMPAIALPKGGGAIRGIGEKVTTKTATGTASLGVPIAISPGRGGFHPGLSLAYESAAGNGPFGLGWSPSLPHITRKTDKGLPRYDDAGESDVFIVSDAEDLVPVVDAGGDRVVDTASAPGFAIHRYRPRVESQFARIERWTRLADRDVHWRTFSRENILSIYGDRPAARIADPLDPTRVFSWLIRETRDDRGNAIVYEYKAEDGTGIDLGLAHERNRGARDDLRRTANRYVKRVRYGNRVPLLDESGRRPRSLTDDQIATAGWMFEVVFDYGEHDLDTPTPAEVAPWSLRGDAFSMYRAGFEVRTSRLCRRVLAFHHFPEDTAVGTDCLVRSTDFDYVSPGDATVAPRPLYTYLRSVTQCSYRRRATGYAKRATPPVELEYTAAIVQDSVHEIENTHAPGGVDGGLFRWADLHGEGLAGILSEQGGAWFYQRNVTPLFREAAFAPPERVAKRPNMTLRSGQLLDLAGDGQPDLVALDAPVPGLYEHDEAESWLGFRPFASAPHRPLHDPNLRFVDLDGDGHADLLITEDDAFVWHASLAEAGFGPARRVPQSLDEERGPRLVFADDTEAIHLADLTGDGLADLVRIRNGDVCYWPNLGYGRFGAKVTMDHAPHFDHPDQFDHRRLRLADIDGSGTTDLIYLHRDGVRLYFNECGNRWSERYDLTIVPRVDDLTSIEVVDLRGNGTACIVWSSPSPAADRRNVRYVDLMGGQKPHLLVRCINNLGAETAIDYAPSTKFYLADRAAGTPWVTRLPFPVHVVERVTVLDRISGNRFVSQYSYHHGHFDGVEREFHGFGRVDQVDTEDIPALRASNEDPATHLPPVLTRTWFHMGIYAGGDQTSKQLANEYYRAPGDALLDDSPLPIGLTFDEEREACRALRGMMLRQEIYALDGTARQAHPYMVTEQSFTVSCLQRRGTEYHAVFLVQPRESLGYHYERDPSVPRVTHGATLEVDAYGNVLATAAVSYGRRVADPTLEPRDQAKQAELHVVYACSQFTNPIELADSYRAPVKWESQSDELTGLALPSTRSRFTFEEIANAARDAVPLRYDATPTPGLLERRVLEVARARFRRDDLSAPLAFGQLESRSLPFETYKLALTPGLVTRLYDDKVDDALLAEAGYVHLDGDDLWWIPSGRTFFADTADPSVELTRAREHFFLATRHVDPFGHVTSIVFDANDLLLVDTIDAVGNHVTASNDHRVLAPWLVSDANGNRIAVSFDIHGLVVGTAVMGKAGELPRRGDLLDGFEPDLDDTVIAAHLAQPFIDPAAILGRATSRLVYDLFAYHRTRHQPQPEPATVYSLGRDKHDADLAPGEQPGFIHGFTYTDGFGREIQSKGQAEPGPSGDPRWVATGWTIFNNKGKPARQYEPFFSPTHRYAPEVHGLSPIPLYDPIGRVVASVRPDHAWDKTIFSAWRHERWDVSDTVLVDDPSTDADVGALFRALPPSDYLPTWHARRRNGALGDDARDAALKAAVHAATPAIAHTDSMGRVVLTISHERSATVDTHHTTRVDFDLENNVRAVFDARDRVIERVDYAMLGIPTRRSSMDAGERWMLPDVRGHQIRAWDSRGHEIRTEYDALGRVLRRRLRTPSEPTLRVVEHITYGEDIPDAATRNLRGKPAVHRDSSGVLVHDAYDFKGYLLGTTRQLVRDFTTVPDWAANPELDTDTFIASTTYDALGRPIANTAPDGSVYRATFNESSLLERVDVELAGTSTPFVRAIDYDAKGQRQRIVYGNDVTTDFTHDPETFRLVALQTRRGTELLQDLHHTYDPSGNLTRIRDQAIPTIYFANQVVTGDNDYTYDSLYRLIEATGREHLGQANAPQASWNDSGRTRRAHPGDGQAMQRYTEQYTYDSAGNLEALVHAAAAGNWTRRYHYEAPSALDPSVNNNRLTRTQVGNGSTTVETYSYDAHGNTIAMPHLPTIGWDFRDLLQTADLGGGGTAFYAYDASGKRTRKVVVRDNGRRVESRIYMGGYELYRELQDGVVRIARETLHVRDDRRRLAIVETRTAGSEPGVPARLIRYQLGNHLGSASLELDEMAQILSYEEYTPYGSTSYQAVRNQLETPKRYRYVAMERDDETGFAYHGARYYVPWLGRWSSADPIGIAGGSNVYAYCDGDPINRRDVNGNEWTLAELNKRFDTDRNGTLTLKEVTGGIGCVKGVTLEDWAGMMNNAKRSFVAGNYSRIGGYYVDDNVYLVLGAFYQKAVDENMARLALAYEQNETTLRMDSDGSTYTNRGRREANKKWLNRHRDPARLKATAVAAVVVAAPEVAAVVVAADTGVKTGEAITGTHSGFNLDDVLSGDVGKKTGEKMTPDERAGATKDAFTGWAFIGMSWLLRAPAATARTAPAVVRLTTAQIGQIGEQAAIDWLKARGYTNIRSIQNASGHGIDLVAELKGQTHFFEVKASESATAGALSKDQKTITSFVTSRLQRASNATGQWKNVSAAASQDAGALLDQINQGTLKIQGEVFKVTNVGSASPTITSVTW